MHFPRFTREENLACKLTDKQIEEIQRRRILGESYGLLAKKYEVTPQAIYYWCISEEKRKERRRNKKWYLYKNLFDHKKYRERKKELHPELKEYERLSCLRNKDKRLHKKWQYERERYRKMHPIVKRKSKYGNNGN